MINIIKKINKGIENFYKYVTSDSLAETITKLKKERKTDIDKHEPRILKWFEDNWYTVVSKNDSPLTYSYNVVLGKRLESKQRFTFDEMLIIINI